MKNGVWKTALIANLLATLANFFVSLIIGIVLVYGLARKKMSTNTNLILFVIFLVVLLILCVAMFICSCKSFGVRKNGDQSNFFKKFSIFNLIYGLLVVAFGVYYLAEGGYIVGVPYFVFGLLSTACSITILIGLHKEKNPANY